MKAAASRKSFSNLFKLSMIASRSTSSEAAACSSNGILLQSFQINSKICLSISKGSVVDFAASNGAIVNAANEGCLGGGGVDGAITSAGGDNLAMDREKLPLLPGGIRCPTGQAKLTGPGDYDMLRVPYVIHAVGPNYMFFDDDDIEAGVPDDLLRGAYQSALDVTLGTPIQSVAFALLSAGIFRGSQSLSTVLGIGIEALRDWSLDKSKTSKSDVRDIVLYAFNDREARILIKVCELVLKDCETIEAGLDEEEETIIEVMKEATTAEEDSETAGDCDEDATPEANPPERQETAKMETLTKVEGNKEDTKEGNKEDTEESICAVESPAAEKKTNEKKSTANKVATDDTTETSDKEPLDEHKHE